jgi:clan AA aspartic protease
MIGKVYGRQPRIEVPLILPNRRHLAIEFVIDTGFDGFLMLPVAAVTALKLPFLYRLDANLADDRLKSTRVYGTTIIWSEQEIDVQVLAMGKRPLLGTLLLDGNKLTIPFRDEATVTIEPL